MSVTCPNCGQVLARWLPDGSWELRHRGRVVRCRVLTFLHCDRCYADIEVEEIDKGVGLA